MLFDTHSPRRRRAVQITFASLAILMGGGLVLFGIGGTQGGGLVDGINQSGTVDATKEAEKNQKAAQEALAANPKDEAAAAKLALANLQLAANKGFDAKGNVAKEGQQYLDAANAAWTNYLKLGPAKPDAKVAYQYITYYLTPGAIDYAKATRALEAVLVTRKPSAGLYAQLAFYSIAAGDNAKYKTARAKSLALATSKERRDAIAEQLDDVEKQVRDAIAAQAKQAKEAGDATTKTTPQLQSLPGLGGASTGLSGLGG
jgi:hypothetical protein